MAKICANVFRIANDKNKELMPGVKVGTNKGSTTGSFRVWLERNANYCGGGFWILMIQPMSQARIRVGNLFTNMGSIKRIWLN